MIVPSVLPLWPIRETQNFMDLKRLLSTLIRGRFSDIYATVLSYPPYIGFCMPVYLSVFLSDIRISHPLIAQDKLFHRQKLCGISLSHQHDLLIPSTWPAYPIHMTSNYKNLGCLQRNLCLKYVKISKRQYLVRQIFSHHSLMSKSFLTSLKCFNNVTHVNDAVWRHDVFFNRYWYRCLFQIQIKTKPTFEMLFCLRFYVLNYVYTRSCTWKVCWWTDLNPIGIKAKQNFYATEFV